MQGNVYSDFPLRIYFTLHLYLTCFSAALHMICCYFHRLQCF